MGTFLLGVGCQKGGTSWIYEYLEAHPQADLGPKKEHHVFDALFVPDMQPDFQRRIGKLLAYLGGTGPLPDRATLRSASYLFDIESYFEHFHYRLLRDAETRITADLTPDYCALPVEGFRMVRDGFLKRGVPVKVLFILRDPVARCWSHVRMLRRQDAMAGRVPVYPTAEAQLAAQYATEHFQLRTRYDRTLAALGEVFAPSELHVVLYETLFTEPGITSLCEFLGITPVAPRLERRVHAAEPTLPPPDELQDAVARHYAPVYSAAMKRFGALVIEACWASADRLAVGAT